MTDAITDERLRDAWEHGNEAIRSNAHADRKWNGTVFKKGTQTLVALTFGETVQECVDIAKMIAAIPETDAALAATDQRIEAQDKRIAELEADNYRLRLCPSLEFKATLTGLVSENAKLRAELAQAREYIAQTAPCDCGLHTAQPVSEPELTERKVMPPDSHAPKPRRTMLDGRKTETCSDLAEKIAAAAKSEGNHNNR